MDIPGARRNLVFLEQEELGIPGARLIIRLSGMVVDLVVNDGGPFEEQEEFGISGAWMIIRLSGMVVDLVT